MLTDVLKGTVHQVIDGDTVGVLINWASLFNSRVYNRIERVRLSGYDAPEKGTLSRSLAGAYLRKALLGQSVRLTVHARDPYGRLVCDVTPN